MTLTNRQYKDRLFVFIFGREENKEWTLSLYNAINGSHYSDPSAIEITTIQEVIYLGMHNDVSFLIADELNLYEQQASYNPNMPLRQLQYLSLLYEGYLQKNKDKYDKFGRYLIPLPVPRCVVFYNGLDKLAEETTLHLSDAFPKGMKGDVEVTVRMLNINYGKNKSLLEACKPLTEYAWIVQEIRKYNKVMDIKQAIDAVIVNLPNDFILKPFLEIHKAEVGDMLLTEYNEIQREELLRKTERKEGLKKGIKKGRKEGLKKGTIKAVMRNIQSIMESLHLSFEQAATVLKIPAEEYDFYRNSIIQKNEDALEK